MSVKKREDQITLYACPHACSLVSHLALEFVGANFEVKWVDLFKQEQMAEQYLAISPRGKVPLLVRDEVKISENVAILIWLSQQFPHTQLLPASQSQAFVEAITNLSWFSSGIHQHLSRVVVPQRFASTQDHTDDVQKSAMAALAKEFALIDQHMAKRDWWGESFSALDFYPFWLWARSGESVFDQSPYKNYSRYIGRLLTLPAVKRALKRERNFMDCYPDIGA